MLSVPLQDRSLFNICHMKKPSVILILLSLLAVNVLAQEEHLEFIGVLHPKGLNPISYKLSFNIDAEGLLSGTSITDFYGTDRTVSKITGIWQVEEGLLSFQEMENLSTNSEADPETFCYVHVSNLAVKEKGDTMIIDGSFEGRFPDSVPCASGSVRLLSAQVLERTLNDNPEIEKELLELNHPALEALTKSRSPRRLPPEAKYENGASVSLDWLSDTLKFAVWDSFEEDGDRINIYLNEAMLVSDLKVLERKRYYQVPVASSPTVLRFEAVAEGSNPPATIHVHLIDNNDVQGLVVKLKKDESVSLEVWPYH